jgi:hypothetical protein
MEELGTSDDSWKWSRSDSGYLDRMNKVLDFLQPLEINFSSSADSFRAEDGATEILGKAML